MYSWQTAFKKRRRARADMLNKKLNAWPFTVIWEQEKNKNKQN